MKFCYTSRFLVSALAMFTTTHLMAAPATQTPSGAKAVIQKAYMAENAAAARKDLKGQWKYRTADFVYTDQSGARHTGEGLRSQEQMVYSHAKSIKATTRIEKFTLNNKTQATVIAAENATVTFSNPQTRKNVVMKMSGRVRDTWVFRNARWLKSQTKSLSQIVMMDGKRVQ